MSILTLFAVVLIILAAGQITAFIAIWFRHAIPRSPNFFHWILFPSMVVMFTATLVLVRLALTGEEEFLGIPSIVILLAYFSGAAITWWTLNAYAVYHYIRMQRRQTEERRGIEERLDRVSVEAEDRYSEAELEKHEVRSRLEVASAASKEDLADVRDEITRGLDEIKKKLDKGIR